MYITLLLNKISKFSEICIFPDVHTPCQKKKYKCIYYDWLTLAGIPPTKMRLGMSVPNFGAFEVPGRVASDDGERAAFASIASPDDVCLTVWTSFVTAIVVWNNNRCYYKYIDKTQIIHSKTVLKVLQDKLKIH